MRKLYLLIIPLMLVACSSANKQPDATPSQATTPPPAPQAQMTKSDANPDSVKKIACESDQDKRSLEVLKKGSGCELSYTKFGKAKVVASGKYGVKHCEASFEKIVKKLKAQNFKCDDT